jgi:hypothetical protein
MDKLDGPVQVGAGLIMYSDYFRTMFSEPLDITVRVNDHKMYVERLLGVFLDLLQYREAKRKIGYKKAVHDVDMKKVGTAVIDHLNVFPHVTKITGKH